jgi:UDP:flavonoid glycosyltransferase YjiC (YdhE family)
MAKAFTDGTIKLNKMLQEKNGKGVRCIVSFRTTEFEWPSDSKERFWISNWTPQVELLAHPNLKAGVHHCGLGGSLEFINSEVPALTVPHFGDQGMNARNIIENGAGLPLHDSKIGDRQADESSMALSGVTFTADQFANQMFKLLTNS